MNNKEIKTQLEFIKYYILEDEKKFEENLEKVDEIEGQNKVIAKRLSKMYKKLEELESEL